MDRRLVLLLFILALGSTAVWAQESTAQELFKVHCQTCHGPQGLGDGPVAQSLTPPPRNLTVRPYKQGCGPGAIVHTLKSGVPESAMPSFDGTLSEDEMWLLARYVRSLQSRCCEK